MCMKEQSLSHSIVILKQKEVKRNIYLITRPHGMHLNNCPGRKDVGSPPDRDCHSLVGRPAFEHQENTKTK